MSSDTPFVDRRKQHELRAVFPAAYEALRPFFDPSNQWGSHSHEHLAYRTLKEHFPDLSAQDSFLIVITARRLFSQGRTTLSA